MTRRVTIVLPIGADIWRVANLTEGFVRAGEELARGGFAVELVAPPGASTTPVKSAAVDVTRLTFTGPPIIAGPAPAGFSASLRAGHQLWRHLAASPPDIVLAPLVGGVLQPALMSRHLAESLDQTTMVIWGEASTAERLALGDLEPAGIETVVAEAMEATALSLADAVIGPAPGGDPARHIPLILPARAPPDPAGHGTGFDEIVFVGPASGRHGTPAALSAVEFLGHAGRLTNRRVVFLGPWREGLAGLGKSMLGRRAQDWRFAFTQIDESDPAKVLDYLRRPGLLAVFAGAAADDDVILADAARAGVAIALCTRHSLSGRLGGSLAELSPDLSNLGELVEAGVPDVAAANEDASWPQLFEALIAERRSRPAAPPWTAPSASLCITHRDRPTELAAALASRAETVGPGLETIIVDTGSESGALQALDALAGGDIQVVKGPAGSRQAWARNLAAGAAKGEILVFLDDDNLFLDDGLSRLVSAFANPNVDIVVSTLSLYDTEPGQGPPAADLVFMGQTAMAGLLFNSFGDANFAIRRNRFVEIGGFADDDAAAFDWVFFAAAQARGLKIGVLQRPAIAYRRDLAGRDARWRKRDLEGPRRHVLGAYDLDPSSTVIAALSQCLSLPLLD
jgi:hypothetical protein